MKPFDLEAALRGEPVITRDGQAVTQITIFSGVTHFSCLRGVVSGAIKAWRSNGSWNGITSGHDLFMAPKKITLHLRLTPAGQLYNEDKIYGNSYSGVAYRDKADAENTGSKSIPFEVEL